MFDYRVSRAKKKEPGWLLSWCVAIRIHAHPFARNTKGRAPAGSVQVEGDVDDDLDGDGMALVHGGLELVLTGGFYSFLVETHAEVANDADVLRVSLLIDDELDGGGAREVGLTSIFREF